MHREEPTLQTSHVSPVRADSPAPGGPPGPSIAGYARDARCVNARLGSVRFGGGPMRADRGPGCSVVSVATAVAPLRRSYRKIRGAPMWEARCGPTVVLVAAWCRLRPRSRRFGAPTGKSEARPSGRPDAGRPWSWLQRGVGCDRGRAASALLQEDPGRARVGGPMRADRGPDCSVVSVATAVAPLRRFYRKIRGAPMWEARCGPTVVLVAAWCRLRPRSRRFGASTGRSEARPCGRPDAGRP